MAYVVMCVLSYSVDEHRRVGDGASNLLGGHLITVPVGIGRAVRDSILGIGAGGNSRNVDAKWIKRHFLNTPRSLLDDISLPGSRDSTENRLHDFAASVTSLVELGLLDLLQKRLEIILKLVAVVNDVEEGLVGGAEDIVAPLSDAHQLCTGLQALAEVRRKLSNNA